MFILPWLKSQQMHCVVCHNVQQEDYVQYNIQCHEGLVMYNEEHKTTTMNLGMSLMNILLC